MIRKYTEIFCWKNVSSFCTAKATHMFSAKNIKILYIESAKTVNEMTLNELVTLTTLWTTGPRSPHISIMRIDSWELPLSAIPLCQLLLSSWASQAKAFPQPVCERLSWLHHWSVPHVHNSGVFSPTEWCPAPQCQAAQVVHWTWWWQCLAAWHCRSVWSSSCR